MSAGITGDTVAFISVVRVDKGSWTRSHLCLTLLATVKFPLFFTHKRTKNLSEQLENRSRMIQNEKRHKVLLL